MKGRNMEVIPEAEDVTTGRLSDRLFQTLKLRIADGQYVAGQFLPGQRALAEEHEVAQNTVRRALGKLGEAGLVRAEPRRGYRVLAHAGDPDRGMPIAFVSHGTYELPDGSDSFGEKLLREFTRITEKQKWSLLVVAGKGRSTGEIMDQLTGGQVCGVLTEHHRPDLVAMASRKGVPMVVLDSLSDLPDVNTVVQDGAMGGTQAAAYLLEKDCRRLAWVTPRIAGSDPQIAERWGGFHAGLARSEAKPAPTVRRVHAPLGRPEQALACARRMLSSKNLPTGIVALWQELAVAVTSAADELGLVIGKDFEMVSWCTREEYEAGFAQNLPGKVSPAMVTWSIAEMAAAAMARLRQLRTDPGLPAVQVKIKTQLQNGGEDS